MNKITTLFFGMLSSLGIAQCDISGASTLQVGQSVTYATHPTDVQCKDCHQWAISGDHGIISTDKKLNKIDFKATRAGNATVSLVYLSPRGVEKCSKEIQIIDPTATKRVVQKTQDSDCDIEFADFKEVKINENTIAFFPNSSQKLNYTWETHYQNGQIESSTDKVPQFTLSAKNPIVSVKIKLTSAICFKQISKSYDASYWKALK